MASLCREPRPLRKEWGWAKCALYAARKEFELLKLLSTADKKVVAMARTMGQAAVNAPSGQENAAAPIRPDRARRQAPGESDRGRAVPARGSMRVKRSKQERRQRQEAANKCQALVRSYLVRKVRMPIARERAAARAVAESILKAASPSTAPASEWAVVIPKRGRRSRSLSPPTQSWEAVEVDGCMTMTASPDAPRCREEECFSRKMLRGSPPKPAPPLGPPLSSRETWRERDARNERPGRWRESPAHWRRSRSPGLQPPKEWGYGFLQSGRH